MATLAGKTLFVTGSSRGIGLAIAKRAAVDGANIIVVAKTAEPHPKLPGTVFSAAEEIEEAGGQALPVVCRRRAGCGAIWWHRYRRQQCERDRVAAYRTGIDESIRSHALGKCARHVSGIQDLFADAARCRKSTHIDVITAAQHARKMVRTAFGLFDGQVRHEPVCTRYGR